MNSIAAVVAATKKSININNISSNILTMLHSGLKEGLLPG
jgi:hypothetical protein